MMMMMMMTTNLVKKKFNHVHFSKRCCPHERCKSPLVLLTDQWPVWKRQVAFMKTVTTQNREEATWFWTWNRHLCSHVQPPLTHRPELPAGGWTELRKASIVFGSNDSKSNIGCCFCFIFFTSSTAYHPKSPGAPWTRSRAACWSKLCVDCSCKRQLFVCLCWPLRHLFQPSCSLRRNMRQLTVTWGRMKNDSVHVLYPTKRVC